MLSWNLQQKSGGKSIPLQAFKRYKKSEYIFCNQSGIFWRMNANSLEKSGKYCRMGGHIYAVFRCILFILMRVRTIWRCDMTDLLFYLLTMTLMGALQLISPENNYSANQRVNSRVCDHTNLMKLWDVIDTPTITLIHTNSISFMGIGITEVVENRCMYLAILSKFHIYVR